MVHFDVHGLTDEAAPAIILSSGLGGSGSYWAAQLDALAPHFKIVTYDHRGTGRTGGEVPAEGGIASMAADVLDLADRLGLARFSFMGHALGGLIGLEITTIRPEILDRLVLVNAWGRADPHSGRCFDVRIELLQESGVAAFIKAQPLFLYPALWMSENADRLEAEDAHLLDHFQGETNILRRIAALRAFDIEDRIGSIQHPTLVIAAKDDLLVPYSRSTRLSEQMPNAQLALLDYGAHAVNVVCPDRFNEVMMSYLVPDQPAHL